LAEKGTHDAKLSATTREVHTASWLNPAVSLSARLLALHRPSPGLGEKRAELGGSKLPIRVRSRAARTQSLASNPCFQQSLLRSLVCNPLLLQSLARSLPNRNSIDSDDPLDGVEPGEAAAGARVLAHRVL